MSLIFLKNEQLKKNKSSFSLIFLKILLNHFQELSIMTSINVNWSFEALDFINKNKEYLAFSEPGFFFNSCILTWFLKPRNRVQIFSLKKMIFSLFPFLISILVSLVFLLIMCLFSKIKRDFKLKFLPRVKISFLISFFIFYPIVVRNAFDLFNCITLSDNEDSSFLYYFPDIECWSQHHLKLVYSIGIPSIIGWGCAIPFILLYKLTLKKQLKLFFFRFSKKYKDSVLKMQLVQKYLSEIEHKNQITATAQQIKNTEISNNLFQDNQKNINLSEEIPEKDEIKTSIIKEINEFEPNEKSEIPKKKNKKTIKQIGKKAKIKFEVPTPMEGSIGNHPISELRNKYSEKEINLVQSKMNLETNISNYGVMKIRKKFKTTTSFSFFTNGYKTHLIYWEFHNFIRKFCLIFLVSMNQMIQSSTCSVLVLLMLFLHFTLVIKHGPYAYENFNSLQIMSIIANLVTILGITYLSFNNSENVFGVFSVAIFVSVMHVLFLVYCLIIIFRQIKIKRLFDALNIKY